MAETNPDNINELNSLTLPVESVPESVIPEELKRGERNVLWLTVREGRTFILKGLTEILRSHPEEVARLRKEYSLGLRINHPGVAGVYGFEVNPDLGPVVVMEYVDGITLHKFLSEGKPKPVEVRLKVARQIADALNHIHSLGMSHRDLKPNNILITRRNDVKIIDWGLGDSEDAVTYKLSLGTAEFGAPEQQHPFPADSRADVYSFGRILEHLLPEKRFRKLREECQKPQPQQRITMQEVSEQLSGVYKGKSRAKTRSGISIGIAIFVLCVGGLFYMYLSQSAESDRRLENETVETSKSVTSAENPEQDETSAMDGVTDGGSAIGTVVTRQNVGNTDKKAVVNVEQANENARSESEIKADYEAIFNRHLKNAVNVINEIGPGFLHDKGYYDYAVLSARSAKVAPIVREAVEELSAAGCSYNELSKFSQRLNEEIQRAYDRIDGVNK